MNVHDRRGRVCELIPFKFNTIRLLLAILLCGFLSPGRFCVVVAGEPVPPRIVANALTHKATVIPQKSVTRLEDGTLLMLMTKGDQCFSTRSSDNGKSWSKPQPEFKTPHERSGVALVMRDRHDELHAFLLVARGDGRKPTVNRFYDIYHGMTKEDQKEWLPLQPVYEGYVGSLNGVTQLDNGRIVLAHQYWVPGRTSTPPTGSHVVTSSYSDDDGKSWQLSPAQLTAPCHKDYTGSNYGACEPCLIQLLDGNAWMLMRTQTGLLYESTSVDGINWSPAEPTPFRSSNSPASLVRLSDKRLVLFWNQCEDVSRVDGAPVYTNRDALHAAISSDDGQTWHGYREVYRDPLRNDSPPEQGDRGTAYPYAVEMSTGHILLGTGQSAARVALIEIDPEWIDATQARGDFSAGLEDWSTYKPFGPAHRYWRDRTTGAKVIDHPTQPDKKVLHVRRPDDKQGDDAVWNFPAGNKGQLSIELFIPKDCLGAQLSLADRHITPDDSKANPLAVFKVPLSSNFADTIKVDGTSLQLERERWLTVDLNWDLTKKECRVSVDGKTVQSLPMNNAEAHFVNYLRLQSTALGVDNVGFLVNKIDVTVER